MMGMQLSEFLTHLRNGSYQHLLNNLAYIQDYKTDASNPIQVILNNPDVNLAIRILREKINYFSLTIVGSVIDLDVMRGLKGKLVSLNLAECTIEFSTSDLNLDQLIIDRCKFQDNKCVIEKCRFDFLTIRNIEKVELTLKNVTVNQTLLIENVSAQANQELKFISLTCQVLDLKETSILTTVHTLSKIGRINVIDTEKKTIITSELNAELLKKDFFKKQHLHFFVETISIQTEGEVKIIGIPVDRLSANKPSRLIYIEGSYLRKVTVSSTHHRIILRKSLLGEVNLQEKFEITHLELVENMIKEMTATDINIKREFVCSGNYFRETPNFIETKFPVDTFFGNNRYKIYNNKSIVRFRKIKENFEALKNDEDELIYAAHEMKARGNSKDFSSHVFFRFADFFARMMNNYGESLFRPMALNIFMMVAFSLLYHLWFNPDNYFDKDVATVTMYWGNWIVDKSNYGRSLFFAVINGLGPLHYFSSKDVLYVHSIWGKGFVFIQNIFSTVLLYLFIAGIKKRFRQN